MRSFSTSIQFREKRHRGFFSATVRTKRLEKPVSFSHQGNGRRGSAQLCGSCSRGKGKKKAASSTFSPDSVLEKKTGRARNDHGEKRKKEKGHLQVPLEKKKRK